MFRYILNNVNYMVKGCDTRGMDRYDALSAADAKGDSSVAARA